MKKNITLLGILFAFACAGTLSIGSAQEQRRNTPQSILTAPAETSYQLQAPKQSLMETPRFTPSPTAIFHEDFESAATLPAGWTVLDNDGDGFNWSLETAPSFAAHGGVNCVASFSYDNGTRTALTPDNYLITPLIQIPDNLSNPGLSFWVAPQDPNFPAEQFQVKICTDASAPAAVASFTTELTNQTITWTDWAEIRLDLSAYSGQQVRFAFVHHGSSDQFAMKIDDVQVMSLPDVDLSIDSIGVRQITPLTATEPVSITIKNDGVSAANNVSATLKINGTEIVTETIPSVIPASESLVYTFQTTADFSAYGVYHVEAFIGAEGNIPNADDTMKIQVANLPELAMAWDFEQGLPGDFTMIKNDNNAIPEDYNGIFNGEAWNLVSFQSPDPVLGRSLMASCALFNGAPADRWLISPKVSLQGDNVLLFDILSLSLFLQDVTAMDSYKVLLSTTTNDRAAFTTELKVENNLSMSLNTFIDLSAYNGQEVYIAFVNNSNGSGLLLDNIRLYGQGGKLLDLGVRNPVISDQFTDAEPLKVTIYNEGTLPAANAVVEALLDGRSLCTETLSNPVPGRDSLVYTFTHTVDLSAYGEHTLAVVIKHPDDSNPMNDTTGLQFASYPEVSHTWDFENGMDDNLIMHTYDENRITADVASQLGIEPNTAWTVLSTSGSFLAQLLGEQCAASLSLFDEQDNAADRWMVLPKMKLTQDNFLHFNAVTLPLLFGQLAYASYKVLLSTTTDEPDAYTEVLAAEEQMLMENAYINLSAYAGQEVYIAFVNTSVGTGVIVDNIFIMGDASIVSSLTEISQNQISIYPNPVNDMLYINATNVEQVIVSDMQGREVLKSQINHVDVSALNAGMYVVKVITPDGISTSKIVKK